MIKIWRHGCAPVLGAVLFVVANVAHAGRMDESSPAQPYVAANYGFETLQWDKGQYVNLCDNRRGRCQSVKMPKTLGKVERVVAGPLVSSVRTSWLAMTKFDTYVCAALKSRTTVACAKVEQAAMPADEAEVAFDVTPENRARIALKSPRSTLNGDVLSKQGAAFSRAVWKSAFVLQGEVDQAVAGMSTFASSIAICDKDPRYPGPPPQPDCDLVEEGNEYIWSCPIPGTPPPVDPPPMPDPVDPPCM